MIAVWVKHDVEKKVFQIHKCDPRFKNNNIIINCSDPRDECRFKKAKHITIAYASRVDKRVYPCPRFFKPKAWGARESRDGEDVDQHLTESILPLSNVMSFTFSCRS